LLELDNLD